MQENKKKYNKNCVNALTYANVSDKITYVNERSERNGLDST